MNALRIAPIVAALACAMSAAPALAQESGTRQELKRADLEGAPGMEVIASISEYQPGEILGRHFHHGIESAYVLQGSVVQAPGQEPGPLPTGAAILFERNQQHAGFKIVGDTPLKIYAVHTVDKGKPLYDWVK